jgi:hypothetical protein
MRDRHLIMSCCPKRMHLRILSRFVLSRLALSRLLFYQVSPCLNHDEETKRKMMTKKVLLYLFFFPHRFWGLHDTFIFIKYRFLILFIPYEEYIGRYEERKVCIHIKVRGTKSPARALFALRSSKRRFISGSSLCLGDLYL